MNRLISRVFSSLKSPLLFFIFTLICCLPAAAEFTFEIKDTRISADKGYIVDAGEKSWKVVAIGNVTVEKKNFKIVGDAIVWKPGTGDLYAEGDVTMSGRNIRIKLKDVVYNMKNKYGKIAAPRVHAGTGLKLKGALDADGGAITRQAFISGRELEIDGNRYTIKHARVTTCGYAKPHYTIHSSVFRLADGEKVESIHNWLTVGPVPVFYFPYLFRDLKYDWPWFQVGGGRSDDWGFYGNLKTRPKIGDKEITLTVDYMELRGAAGGLNLEWLDRTRTQLLTLETYAVAEQWRGDRGKGLVDQECRYMGKINYTNRFTKNLFFQTKAEYYRRADRFVWEKGGDYRTSESLTESPFGGDAGFVEKRGMRADYFRDDYRSGIMPESYSQMIWSRDPFSLRGLVKFRVNSFKEDEEIKDTVIEYLPGVRFDTHSMEIARTGVYLDTLTRLDSLRKTESIGINRDTSDLYRVYNRSRISYPVELMHGMTLEPYVGSEHVYFSRTRISDEDSLRSSGLYGGSLSTNIHGTYDVRCGALQVNKLRHVIIPRIDYEGVAANGVENRDLEYFDENDILDDNDRIGFRLENRLETKRNNASALFAALDTELSLYPERNSGSSILRVGTRFYPRDFLSASTEVFLDLHEGVRERVESITFDKDDRMALTVTNYWAKGAPSTTYCDAQTWVGHKYRLHAYFTQYWGNNYPGIPEGISQYGFTVMRRFHIFALKFEYKVDTISDDHSFYVNLASN